MKKRRFNKKSIMGIIKTYHAKERQIERNISDLQLIKILQNGEFEDRSEHEVVMTLDGYHIHLSHDLEKIITVIAPDKQGSSSKLLPSKTANKIKREMLKLESNDSNEDELEITFDEYMKNEFK
jgi:hypothetical protein